MKAGRAAPYAALGSALVGALALVVLLATPAGAAPVLAEAKPWHYWLGVVLAASFLGLAALLGVGYGVRVVMARYGVRIGRR